MGMLLPPVAIHYLGPRLSMWWSRSMPRAFGATANDEIRMPRAERSTQIPGTLLCHIQIRER